MHACVPADAQEDTRHVDAEVSDGIHEEKLADALRRAATADKNYAKLRSVCVGARQVSRPACMPDALPGAHLPLAAHPSAMCSPFISCCMHTFHAHMRPPCTLPIAFNHEAQACVSMPAPAQAQQGWVSPQGLTAVRARLEKALEEASAANRRNSGSGLGAAVMRRLGRSSSSQKVGSLHMRAAEHGLHHALTNLPVHTSWPCRTSMCRQCSYRCLVCGVAPVATLWVLAV